MDAANLLTLICKQCGCNFAHQRRRGPLPMYCSRVCNDKAYSARKLAARSRALHTKQCRQCDHEFSTRYATKLYCSKHCMQKAKRTRCKSDPLRRMAKNAVNRAYKKQTRGAVLDAWYGNGCRVCGVCAPSIMAAHHTDPTMKDCQVSKISNAERLHAELAKCIPLCMNHHALVHEAERNGGHGLAIDELVDYVRIKYANTL